jgi:dTDP-glucose 4,6-dehydratase
VRKLLVTGGAGFIGSHFVRHWCKSHPEDELVVLDALTYAGNRSNLADCGSSFRFVEGDICDAQGVEQLLLGYGITTIVNLAAESHVDRSIAGPRAFLRTNVVGCGVLLEAFYRHWLDRGKPADFRFLQVSTDEVYGSLSPSEEPFTERSPFAPNSPYAASKASADHWVRAYGQTYGLPTLVSHCSNNYGPYQYPEKLIPLMIVNGLRGLPLPIYGDGQQVRDWISVADHCRGLETILLKGEPGERYNVGGNCELTNLALVQQICDLLNQVCQGLPVADVAALIEFVGDRPGHDRRYGLNSQKLQALGWRAQASLAVSLRETVCWYRDRQDWWQPLLRSS